MGTNKPEMPLHQFKFKLSSRSPRDVKLAERMKRDLEQGEVNLSGVVKELLSQWYDLRDAVGYIPAPGEMASLGVIHQLPEYAGGEVEEEETYADPADPLTQKLLGVSQAFENI